MKVGDLVCDKHYGLGIVIDVWKDTSFVHFYEANKRACLGHDNFGHSLELISEGR